MKEKLIQLTILNYCNSKSPFWRAYRALCRGDSNKAHDVIEKAYRTTHTSSLPGIIPIPGGLTDEELLAVLNEFYETKVITAVNLIAVLIDYSCDLTPIIGIKIKDKDILPLIELYALDTKIASQSKHMDADIREWFEARIGILQNFREHNA